MATKTMYDYSISGDTANGVCNAVALQNEIHASLTVTVAVSEINIFGDNLEIFMKDELSSGEATSLDTLIGNHQGITDDIPNPTMDDGRMIIRSDSRPFGFQTYYTMVGDDSTAGIGMGKDIMWDFTNDDDLVTGDHVPSGMKCKEILIKFLCPIYTKDGCLYFFDAPWGQYLNMDIVIPPDQYYPNQYGGIPSAALGLPAGDVYGYTGTEYVIYCAYLMKYRMTGSCPMGDELNAEGSAVNPIPVGWSIRGRIYTPTSDNVSKGYAELEVHRCHTSLLPGQKISDLPSHH